MITTVEVAFISFSAFLMCMIFHYKMFTFIEFFLNSRFGIFMQIFVGITSFARIMSKMMFSTFSKYRN